MPAKATSTKGRGELGLTQIIAAAVAIADEDGVEALSMRRVADRLGCGVMSLYRHVAYKEQLVALAIDEAFGDEPFPPTPPSTWYARLYESALRQWRCYVRHPWAAATVSFSRPRLGPNGMREMEWALAGMTGLDLPAREKVRLYFIVAAYVSGAAGQVAAEEMESRRAGTDAGVWWVAQAKTLRRLFATGDFPELARLSNAEPLPPAEWFEPGLSALVDGLAARFAPGPGR